MKIQAAQPSRQLLAIVDRNRRARRVCVGTISTTGVQECEESYLVVIGHDCPLQLRRVDPGHEIFHISGKNGSEKTKRCISLTCSPRDKVCGIRYGVRTDADMPVLNKLDSLGT